MLFVYHATFYKALSYLLAYYIFHFNAFQITLLSKHSSICPALELFCWQVNSSEAVNSSVSYINVTLYIIACSITDVIPIWSIPTQILPT